VPSSVPPRRPRPSFWEEVRESVVAGAILLILGAMGAGTVFLVYTVPTRLDHVLMNQNGFREELNNLKNRLFDHDRRLFYIERRP